MAHTTQYEEDLQTAKKCMARGIELTAGHRHLSHDTFLTAYDAFKRAVSCAKQGNDPELEGAGWFQLGLLFRYPHVYSPREYGVEGAKVKRHTEARSFFTNAIDVSKRCAHSVDVWGYLATTCYRLATATSDVEGKKEALRAAVNAYDKALDLDGSGQLNKGGLQKNRTDALNALQKLVG